MPNRTGTDTPRVAKSMLYISKILKKALLKTVHDYIEKMFVVSNRPAIKYVVKSGP